jgi:DNA helicase INO80
MDHFSTVLQRPPHFDEDGSNGAVGEDRGPRGGLRDILNPVSATTQPGTPGAPAPPRPHSSFNLRSPTQQSDYHHPNTYAASPSAATGQSSGSRSILNNPFGPAPSSALPPPLQAPPNIVSAATSSGLQHPPRSPLHAPPVYYPAEIRDRDPIREKSRASSFYDPTADGNRDRERRVSETGSWRSSAQASPPKVSKQSQFWRTLQRHPLLGIKPCPPSFVPDPSLAPSTSPTEHRFPPSLLFCPPSNHRHAITPARRRPFLFFFLFSAAKRDFIFFFPPTKPSDPRFLFPQIY